MHMQTPEEHREDPAIVFALDASRLFPASAFSPTQ